MFGKHHSKKTKDRMSKAHKGQLSGDKNPMFGHKHTEEEKKKISEWGKKWHSEHTHPMTGVRRFGENNPMFGKHLSDEKKNFFAKNLLVQKILKLKKLFAKN